MKTLNLVVLAALLSPAAAFAADPPAAAAPASAPAAAPAAAPAGPPGMDMSKMGPWSRKPTDEKKIKKEIAEFFKAEEETAKKGDMEAMAARVDFPVYMATDDASGKTEAKAFGKDEYIAMMKPMVEHMPKDMKTTHKPTVKVLSDSLVMVTDDFTMTMGKNKMTGSNGALLVKVGDQWKWKMMVEAGWGGMPTPPAGK